MSNAKIWYAMVHVHKMKQVPVWHLYHKRDLDLCVYIIAVKEWAWMHKKSLSCNCKGLQKEVVQWGIDNKLVPGGLRQDWRCCPNVAFVYGSVWHGCHGWYYKVLICLIKSCHLLPYKCPQPHTLHCENVTRATANLTWFLMKRLGASSGEHLHCMTWVCYTINLQPSYQDIDGPLRYYYWGEEGSFSCEDSEGGNPVLPKTYKRKGAHIWLKSQDGKHFGATFWEKSVQWNLWFKTTHGTTRSGLIWQVVFHWRYESVEM